MGLAVLPARLKEEMAGLKEAILSGSDISADPEIQKHDEWVKEFSCKHEHIDRDNIDQILQDEIGKVFLHVLEDAGVYKQTADGQLAFDRFTATLS